MALPVISPIPSYPQLGISAYLGCSRVADKLVRRDIAPLQGLLPTENVRLLSQPHVAGVALPQPDLPHPVGHRYHSGPTPRVGHPAGADDGIGMANDRYRWHTG